MPTLLDTLAADWARITTNRTIARATRSILTSADGARTWADAETWMRNPAVPEADKDRLVLRPLVTDATNADDTIAASIAFGLMTPALKTALARHTRFWPHRYADLEHEAVTFLWCRIRTYPLHRTSAVAANLALDLHNHLYRLRRTTTADRVEMVDDQVVVEALDRTNPTDGDDVDELVGLIRDATRSGIVAPIDAELVLDVAARGYSCDDAAARSGLPTRTAQRRRSRAAMALAELVAA